MPFCSNCGNQLLDNQRFCPKCGTPLATNAAPAAPAQQPTPTAPQQVPPPQPTQATEPTGAAPILGVYRIKQGKLIAGVCTGLAAKYKLNVWIFRVITLFTGIALIPYIILAIKNPMIDAPDGSASTDTSVPAEEDPAWKDSGKKKITAIILSILLGTLGIDRFYLGYTGLGVVKLLTAGGCGIWYIIDIVFLFTGKLLPRSSEGSAPAESLPAGTKIKTVGALLGFFVGLFGALDFYAGNVKRGVVKIILTITGIGAIASVIMNMKDMFGVANEKYLDKNGESFKGEPKIAKILAIINAVVYGVSMLGVIIALVAAIVAGGSTIPVIGSIGSWFSSSKQADDTSAYVEYEEEGDDITRMGEFSPDGFIDPRDSTSYNYQTVNGVTWMTRAMNYQGGNPETYCYDDDAAYCMHEGTLYTWEAAQKACPLGWRLPTDSDFNSVRNNLDIFQQSYPGFRNSKGKFELHGIRLDMWTQHSDGDKATYWYISSKNPGTLASNSYSKKGAMTVYCVMDDFAWLSKPLTTNDLQGYKSSELRILRNAIFARHGHIFKSEELKKFFNIFPWYSAQYSDVSNKLTATEKQNVNLIKSME